MWGFIRKMCVAILLVSFTLSLLHQIRHERKRATDENSSHLKNIKLNTGESGLEYDYYRHTCPRAEQIIRSAVKNLYKKQPKIVPALLRLLFHDCWIEGCDASVMLDAMNGNISEKNVAPNLSLKGFDTVDLIKSDIEEVCPGTVSCADILVLAAREGLLLAGGPYYPLRTGRRDSAFSFPQSALQEIPAPDDDFAKFQNSFLKRGFTDREVVALLGGHNIGTIHCQFLETRVNNFSNTGKPDPSIESGFLNLMKSKCNNNTKSSEEPAIDMGNVGGTRPQFGAHYFNNLLQGKGILHADQQLMANEETATWVASYAEYKSVFRRDFAQVMIKLSSLDPLTKPNGQIRTKCSNSMVI